MEVKKDSARAWWLAARPKTLSGAAVPVMIGLSLAWVDARGYEGNPFSPTAALLCLLFAFVMQIDANLVNDFIDYVRGTDDSHTRLGPPRACAQGWVSIERMKHAIALTTCLACLVGLPLVLFGGLEMIFVGALCLLFCFLYTTHLSYMGLGDVLVLAFFGVVPVCTTYYVQLHQVPLHVVAASLACGIVVDALLLVNNFRDRDTDRQAGKMTLAVRVGPRATLWLYLLCGVVACVLGGAVFVATSRPLAALLPLVYLVLHVVAWLRMKSIWQGCDLNKCLGDTARNIFIYGITVTAGLLLST